jgi:hypothetical protein
MDRAPRSPRRGERLASSAADEEVVEGSPDLLAIAALEDLRVDPGRWVLLETISAAGEPWYNLAP